MKKIYKLRIVPEEGQDINKFLDLLQVEVDKEEERDRLDPTIYWDKTISEILDNEEIQRDFQDKGVHIGYTFPVTISKLDIRDFRDGKRHELKLLYFVDER